jgi:AraC-like DNA-binding protein
MPIYMDRHDVSEGVTAEDLARLHQEDLKIQHEFSCRGFTYWFDGQRKTAFCLIEAPNADAIREMHDKAHGQVPHRVIEVDPILVESFLGRIADPEKTANTELNIINDTGFRTIMVITISRLSLSVGQSAELKSSLDHFHRSITRIINDFSGSVIRHTENYVLVSFESVSHAVKAALDIQSGFGDPKNGFRKNTIDLKIGLSAGDPVTDKKLIFQDAIRLAERMCKVVKGEVIVAPGVKEWYDRENPRPLEDRKGICALGAADEQFLGQLMDYTETAWSDTNIKVDDFSKPVGCSKSQLYRKLVSLTGQSPNTFIRDYRLHEALTMLNRNAGNISEIAFETGFSSPSYFSKCFLKKYGHLPSDHFSAPV